MSISSESERSTEVADRVLDPTVGEPAASRPAAVRRGRLRQPGWLVTGAAGLLVLLVLQAPDRISEASPWTLLRLPLELVVLAAAALLLPARPRRVVVLLAGLLMGLLALLKLLDLGFTAVLGRPFDVLLDWSFFGNGWDYLRAAFGAAAAGGIAIGIVLLVMLVVTVMTLSTRRLAEALPRHRRRGGRLTVALLTAWALLAVLGLSVGPKLAVADRNSSALVYTRVSRIPESLNDIDGYRTDLAVDRYSGVAGDRLLGGLRGKDVLLVFVESYGRSALEDPGTGPGVRSTLDRATGELQAAGFGARSAWLESPTSGGGSWLAHSTLLTGTWVSTAQRYRALVKTQRLTLNQAFHGAGWRTVAVMPATFGPWPESAFYGYDRVYGGDQLGYRGPSFGWPTMPDQYTLAALQRQELGRSADRPVMAEVALVSSHAPWGPLPRMVDWQAVGDGSVFDPMPAQGSAPDLLRDPDGVRTAYGRSIEYSLSSVTSFLATYGTDDTVLVFLGDHQAAPIVTGQDAGRDVPVTIVAKDLKVLDQVAGWGWDTGLTPSADAPQWRMSDFRDRFLAAFSPGVAR